MAPPACAAPEHPGPVQPQPRPDSCQMPQLQRREEDVPWHTHVRPRCQVWGRLAFCPRLVRTPPATPCHRAPPSSPCVSPPCARDYCRYLSPDLPLMPSWCLPLPPAPPAPTPPRPPHTPSFQCNGRRLPFKGRRLPSNDRRLPVKGRRFKGRRLPSNSRRLPFKGRRLPFKGRRLPFKCRRLLFKGRQLPPNSRRLPFKGRRLPFKCRRLLFKGRRLPSNSRRLPFKCRRLPSNSRRSPCNGRRLPSNTAVLPPVAADGGRQHFFSICIFGPWPVTLRHHLPPFVQPPDNGGGVEQVHGGKCVTVFSASNYCGHLGNYGGVVVFDESCKSYRSCEYLAPPLPRLTEPIRRACQAVHEWAPVEPIGSAEHTSSSSHEQQASLKEHVLVQLHQLVARHRNELTAFYRQRDNGSGFVSVDTWSEGV